MAVCIRMKRAGRKNRPFFRIDVFDRRTARDGASIENVGYYDPLVQDDKAKVKLHEERIKYWLSRGAIVAGTIRQFLLDRGILAPEKGKRKKTERERERNKKRRKGMKRCNSKRRQKKLAAIEKAKNKPKDAPKPPEAAAPPAGDTAKPPENTGEKK